MGRGEDEQALSGAGASPDAPTSPRAAPPPLSAAPMMDRTDRHFRYLLRLLAPRVLLYTEMVTTGAVLRGERAHLLAFDPAEHPVALQLGGDDPVDLAEAARIGADLGYDEINLNVGCPSDRVQRGRIGACLMADPERVAECVDAMRRAVDLPVTVKHRIGIDDRDAYEDLEHFVDVVARAGADRFTVHARKAWLSGLSPKENREIPPLRYEDVYRLKARRPGLSIEINGGVRTLDAVDEHLRHVDAVMVGRAAYDDPYLMARADRALWRDASPPPTRREAVERYLPYMARQLEGGVPVQRLTRHLLTLFTGLPGARAWRRHLSVHAPRPGAGIEVVRDALAVASEIAAERLNPAPSR